MLRHEFRPGKLVAGLFLIAAGVAFAGDANGLWRTPWVAIVPLVGGGLCLGGATTVVVRAIRGRRGAETD
ncbi:hypothetical protein FRZ03_03380 [Streptomyces misionensis]|uniref:Uncharacterized protein n=1 Tax=Streptomyces misionensis TaxID=67331 RepID=A0A5C6K369_9ACTN|nr:hypothetical protein [Streptomyces misionensis]TWV56891.1 hypothetical protein FRZ03_03380 [Streptomyces misionensis]